MHTHIRIGVVQWAAKPFEDVEAFCHLAEGYIRSLKAGGADIVVFPEYFSLCLAHQSKGTDEELLKTVAQKTPAITSFLRAISVKYDVHIVGGTLPEQTKEGLYNTCWFFHPDGRTDYRRKTHLTPFERGWNLLAGQDISPVDTRIGKIGILICYEAEFPEIARVQALQGARILIVPYQTDTIQGHSRVNLCAAARAIENEVYVVTAGITGNMPNLSLVEFHYAHSTVFTPCDCFFPTGGVLMAATPNMETAILAELDISLLDRLRREGSVNTITDRRPELYQLT